MLDFFQRDDADPRLRLFACACVRRVWHLVPDPRSRAAVEAVEQRPGAEVYPPAVRAAAGDAAAEIFEIIPVPGGPDAMMDQARHAAATAASGVVTETAFGFISPADIANATVGLTVEAVKYAARAAGNAGRREMKAERVAQSRLLRDIVFNPFRSPPAVEAAWLAWNGGAVANLARAIRDERAYDRLPLLADALEDAGCHDADLLGHCRSGQEHALGCWAVDLLLCKELDP
jgi:hypothetical protein